MIYIDFHSCITANPRFFQNFRKFSILTASPENRREEIEKFCKKHHLKPTKIIMMPNKMMPTKFYPKGFSAFKRLWKVEKIKELNPDVMIDNEELICREIYRHQQEGRIKTQAIFFISPEINDVKFNVKDFPAALLSREEKKALLGGFKREKNRQVLEKLKYRLRK